MPLPTARSAPKNGDSLHLRAGKALQIELRVLAKKVACALFSGRRGLLSLALLACVLEASEIKPETYLAHIKYLASPELKGRRTGTPELEKAAAYIARQFHSAGLKPVGASYMQQ